jgi:hypothetical protein
MTISQFLTAGEGKQIEALRNGTYIGKRLDGVYEITLHRVADFYVECKRHTELNVLRELRAFKNPNLLKPYSDDIGLN